MLQTGKHFRLELVQAGEWHRIKPSSTLADDARWHLFPISGQGRGYVYFRLAAEIDQRAVPSAGVIGWAALEGKPQLALRLMTEDEGKLQLSLQFAEDAALGEVPDVLAFQKKPPL